MKTCKRCQEEKADNEFFVHKNTGSLRASCKQCTAEMVRENRLSNPERTKATNLRNATKDYWRRKDAIGKYKRKYYVAHCDSTRLRVSRNFHTGRAPTIDAELTEFAFEEAYELARLRERHLGGRWTLDHIVPINSPLVCGLHTWANMQVIRDVQNGRKSNKTWPHMP